MGEFQAAGVGADYFKYLEGVQEFVVEVLGGAGHLDVLGQWPDGVA